MKDKKLISRIIYLAGWLLLYISLDDLGYIKGWAFLSAGIIMYAAIELIIEHFIEKYENRKWGAEEKIG